MEHKHAALIKRWADDTSLVVLYKNVTLKWLEATEQESPHWFSGVEYFLVCDKNVEVALHWLSGGDVEINRLGQWKVVACPGFDITNKFRIKPKLEKVKVWIGVKNPKADVMYSNIVTSGTKPIGNEYFDNFIWTEVEANKLIQ